MSVATKPTIEEMAAHIVSEVQYDMRHGKPVSSSCEYAERRIKELVADARATAINAAAQLIDQPMIVDGRAAARLIRGLLISDDASQSDASKGEWRCWCFPRPGFDTSINRREFARCTICGAKRP